MSEGNKKVTKAKTKPKAKGKKPAKKAVVADNDTAPLEEVQNKKFEQKKVQPKVRPSAQKQPPHQFEQEDSGNALSLKPVVSVGNMLRATREEKGLKLEEVSNDINIRIAQLRAIEEDNIDGLPGKTYALGFVRSYANHLGLNGTSIAQQFKMEQGGFNHVKPELNFPEPIVEGPHASFLMISGAVACSIVLLVLWAVFSGGSEDIDMDVAELIPPAPAVETIIGSPQSSSTVLTGQNLMRTPSVVPAGTLDVGSAIKKPSSVVVEARSEPVAPVVVEKKKPEIKLSSSNSRIVIRANRASWIEVKDSNQKTLFKRVLRKGDKYSVPSKKGLTLLTSNAGGIDVIVDGKKIQPLGGRGEIIRGVELDPALLKKVKIKTGRRRGTRGSR